MKEKIEKLDMERLRELGYTLERVLPDDRDIRAKSKEDLAELVAEALEELEIEQPDAFTAVVAEYELNELGLDAEPDATPAPDLSEDAEPAPDEAASVERAAEDEEVPTSKKRKPPSPYDYVQIAGHGADAELRYGDVVPAPRPDLYEVVPFTPLTSKEAMVEVVQEGATLNVDPRWSFGAQEEWAHKHATS